MSRTIRSVSLPLLLVVVLVSGCGPVGSGSSPIDRSKAAGVTESAERLDLGAPTLDADCAVIVIGGSTAALAAAVTSAKEGIKTCLLEPTDWVGGQLTTSGVSAIDFAHHVVDGIDLRGIANLPENNPSEFMRMLALVKSTVATCWVSGKCYVPSDMHRDWASKLRSTPNLAVFDRTVAVRVETETAANGPQVRSVTAIRRAVSGAEWGPLLSEQIGAWYSLSAKATVTSARGSVTFTKSVARFRNKAADRMLVVIDASEFGDGLVLSGSSYLQGPEAVVGDETTEDGIVLGKTYKDQNCGQMFVFPFVMGYATADGTPEPAVVPVPEGQRYSLGSASWQRVWSYRRVKSAARSGNDVLAGDLSEQNWNPGNDYAGRYLFLPRAATDAQRSGWKGGVSIPALDGAERAAIGWYHWMKTNAPAGIDRAKLSMRGSAMGTAHGLAKLPYLRDTRRAVGYKGYVLRARDLLEPRAGGVPSDRLGLGSYVADHHTMPTCSTPKFMSGAANINTRPFYVPFRALTTSSFNNLLVAGKTMAQTYHANSATRLHPIEWSSGTAAGVAAAFMARNRFGAWAIVDQYGGNPRRSGGAIETLKVRAKIYQPIDWTGWVGR